MGLLQRFLEILRISEPEALPDYAADYVSRKEFSKMQDLYAWAIREKREEKMRADCFEALLIQSGRETKKTLTARVELYKKTLLAQVRMKAPRAS